MFPLLLTGLVAGFASGLLGIGGGVILVPALILVLRLSIHQAIAVSLAVVVPIAFTGFIKHFSNGNVPLKLVLFVALGGVIGSVLGAELAHVLSANALKKIFGICMIVIGLNIVFGWSDALKSNSMAATEISEL